MSLTLYARKEPTDDPESRQTSYPLWAARVARKRDVHLYYDRAATKPAGRIPWHYLPPDRRRKFLNLACARWALVWLPDLDEVASC